MAKRSLHSKLDLVRNLVVNKPAAKPPANVPDRYRLLSDRLGMELVCGHSGNYCFTRRLYTDTYRHGDIALVDLLDRTHLPALAYTSGDDPELVPLDNVVFFDLETIGLGGTGAAAFLIGTGSLTEYGFEVRQYLLPDYEDETAMLEAVSAEFTGRTILASYNGAAFDLPILRDRFIVNRVGREIPHARHIDLLHGVRRLFRRRLGDCSLGNIEREVFGFRRVDDIPGFLVPSVFFDWLTGQKLDDMEKVLEHNRHDIVSLFFLAIVLAQVFETRGDSLGDSPRAVDDLHSLSRIFNRRRDLPNVIDLNRRVADIGCGGSLSGESLSGESLPPDILLFHAMAFKRCGDYDNAVRLWQQLAGTDSREGYIACIELAIYCEHKLRDYASALEHTRRAERWSGLTAARRKALVRRRERLMKKTVTRSSAAGR